MLESDPISCISSSRNKFH